MTISWLSIFFALMVVMFLGIYIGEKWPEWRQDCKNWLATRSYFRRHR